mmetsp:Transcript_29450/g.56925  ORF Transcript_29450/g.56925 Transcript_29450/m.56925 type:complete len:120 (+) Transcript_29450:106-465(+)
MGELVDRAAAVAATEESKIISASHIKRCVDVEELHFLASTIDNFVEPAPQRRADGRAAKRQCCDAAAASMLAAGGTAAGGTAVGGLTTGGVTLGGTAAVALGGLGSAGIDGIDDDYDNE